MKKLILKHAMALVALAIAATSVTLMSFGPTPTEKKALSGDWFAVQADNSNEQNIMVGGPAGDGTEGGDCSPTNNGPRCAVELILPHPSYNPENKTIQEIEDDGGEFTGNATKYSD